MTTLGDLTDLAAHRPRRPLVSPLVVLCVAQFVLQLDFSVVNIALKTIQADLDMTAAALQWIVTSYALTFGALLLLGGRLGDVLGRRRLLVGGLWLFGAASLACGLATSPIMLVGARLVQGVGAAMVAPTVLAILTAIYAEGAERTRALGIWTASTAAGGVTGIVAGGLLTQFLGWRSIFLVNLPIIAVLIPLMRSVLPDLPGDRERTLDVVGAVLVTTAIGALILGLTLGEQDGFGAAQAIACFAVFAVLTVAFVVTERTVPAPMVPFAFLAAPVRRTSIIVMMIVGGVTAAYAYFAALYLQRVLGYGEAAAAFGLVPAPFTLGLTSMLLTRRLIARFSIKPVMLAGLTSMVAGQFWLSHVSEGGSYAGGVLPGLVLTTFGMGMVFPTVSVGITARLGRGDQGLAGGLIPTAQQVGMAIGLAVLATVAAAVSRAHGGSLVDGYRTSYLVGTGLVVVALVLVAGTSFAAPAEEAVAEEAPARADLEGSAA